MSRRGAVPEIPEALDTYAGNGQAPLNNYMYVGRHSLGRGSETVLFLKPTAWKGGIGCFRNTLVAVICTSLGTALVEVYLTFSSLPAAVLTTCSHFAWVHVRTEDGVLVHNILPDGERRPVLPAAVDNFT